MLCLSWQVCGIGPTRSFHSASPYWNPFHKLLFQRDFNHTARLIAAHSTLLGDLCGSLDGQVHPSVKSPSVCGISPQIPWYFMDPSSHRQLLVEGVNFWNPVYLLIFLVFFKVRFLCMWASACCTLTTMFSAWTAMSCMSCHSATAQMSSFMHHYVLLPLL